MGNGLNLKDSNKGSSATSLKQSPKYGTKDKVKYSKLLNGSYSCPYPHTYTSLWHTLSTQ